MNDWVEPPWEGWQYKLWHSLFYPSNDIPAHYAAATRAVNPNSISVARMEKFTHACIVAKLKGDHLK